MRPVPSSETAAEEQIELRLMKDMVREALGLPESASTREITVSARTFILLHKSTQWRAA